MSARWWDGKVGVFVALAVVVSLVATVTALTLSDLTRRGEPPLTREDLSPAARDRLEQGPLVVGWFRGAAPVSVWDGDELEGGYAIEQFNLMAVKFGLDFDHVVFEDIPSVVASLREGRIDVAGTHGERPDLLEFAGATEPLAWERITLVGARDEVARAVGTLADRTVTTVAGSPLEQALLAQYPQATYIPTATIPEGLAAVDAGEIDLYLAPLAVAGWANRTSGMDLLPIGENLQVIPISAWAETGTPALEIIRAARSQLTPEEISLLTARWAGFDLGSPVRESTPTWLLVSLWLTIAVVLVATTFAWILRRRVAVATADLRDLNATLEDRVAEATRQLRASNEALRRFGQSVAHDLKNPLAAVFGFAQLLGEPDIPGEEREEMAALVASTAQAMATVVEGMLSDAVHAGADLGERLTGQQFSEWIREVSGPELDITGGRLEVDVPHDLVLSGPLDVLRRATMNLVTNAAKYADNDDGTHVRVSARAVEGHVELQVADNGPGIPPEQRAVIFDVGKRLVVDDRGFGLGLAAVRDLVAADGGSISVEDSELGGIAFTVRLPMAPDDGRSPAQEGSAAATP